MRSVAMPLDLTGRARPLLAIAAVAAASLALAAAGWPASAYQRTDFTQFWLAPRTILEGRTPYELWGWPYPLWTAVALLPLGALPYSYAAGVWLVAQLAGIAAALVALGRGVFAVAPRRDLFLLLGIAAGSQPLWLLIGGGNMTGLLFAALAGAVAAALGGHAVVGGILLALLALKPSAFLVAVPVIVLAAPARRPLLVSAVATFAALVLASLIVRPDWPALWLRNLVDLQSSEGSNATAWTLGRTAPAIPPGALAAAGMLAALGAFLTWWRVRRPPFALLAAGAVPISVFVAPHGWSYDQLHLVLTAAVVLERLSHLGAGERLLGLSALLLAGSVLPWTLYAFAFVRGGEEWSAITPLLFFALLVVADARAVSRARRSTIGGVAASVNSAARP